MTYYIGRLPNDETLHRFANPQTADFECEEWCAIEAQSEESARELFDEKFEEWQHAEQQAPTCTINEKMAIAAVSQDGSRLRSLPEHLKTKKVCLAAVQQYGLALEFVPTKLRTKEMCKVAVKSNGWALEFVPPDVKSPQMCLWAMCQLAPEFTVFVSETFKK